MTAASTTVQLAQQLPYYAKYLLIAAYLASHNDVKLDKRLFVKHHGKQKKTQKTIKAKMMVSARILLLKFCKFLTRTTTLGFGKDVHTNGTKIISDRSTACHILFDC